jgi:hypothetical protein
MSCRVLNRTARVALVFRVWRAFLAVHIGLRRYPLPALVARLRIEPTEPSGRLDPLRLGRIVSRSLTIGRLRPRCLISALVLFRLLRQQGDAAQVVIGLPADPTGEQAHAWVEVAGVDVGPPPGGANHRELARYD